MNFTLIKEDITTIKVDAIVNAANSSLLGGGGVDGAIHAAAGEQLYEECKTLGGCAPGEAKITKGYNLPAKYVIHTVGPIYNPFKVASCEEILSNCYKNSLKLAKEHGIKTIAFPSISTGVYGYPFEDAEIIAVKTVLNFVEHNPNTIDNIIFCAFTNEEYEELEKIMDKWL